MNSMTFDLREQSAIFTLLCSMIRDNEVLTDAELSIYHRFIDEGWEDFINNKRDLLNEMIGD